MLPSYSNSNFTMGTIEDALEPSANNVANQMTDALNSIAESPDASPTDLAAFQAQMQVYMSVIEAESSIIQDMGSVMKQVATNIGS